MLRRFGNLVWRQSRDMSVYNYSNHLVYEIFTNHGYLYVCHDKGSGKVEVINGRLGCNENSHFPKSAEKQSEEVFVPCDKLY